MNHEKPKQFTGEELVAAEKQIKEIEKSRSQYEQNVSDIAEEKNSLLDKIRGTDIDEIDIMHVDATREGSLRDYDKQFPPNKKELEETERTVQSSPYVVEKELVFHPLGFDRAISRTIKGTIDGKDVEITQIAKREEGKVDGPSWHYEIESSGSSPFFDGRRMTIGDAKKMFKEYIDIAESRSLGVAALKERIEKEHKKDKGE